MKANVFRRCFITTAVLLFHGAEIFSQNAVLPKGKCAIVLNDGTHINNAQLWQLHSGIMEYEQNGSLHDAYINDIKSIDVKDSSGVRSVETWIIDDSGMIQKLKPASANRDTVARAAANVQNKNCDDSLADDIYGVLKEPKHDSGSIDEVVHDTVVPPNKSYYDLGVEDAGKYYNGTGAAIGGFYSATPVLGWFIALPVIASTSPSLYNDDNPHVNLLANQDYREGYREKARAKKKTNVWGGFSVGMIIILMAVL